ncbi:MAG: dihydrofolate reductase family protein [Solirubrobacteraceae bacterium]
MTDPELRRLLAADGLPALGDRQSRYGRPWVAANMASSADGRATVGNTSGGLGNAADRTMFAELRAQVDCVLVGTGTLATERYGPIVRNPAVREERERAGRSPQPMCCVVTRTGRVPLDIPLFGDPEQEIALFSGAAVPLQGVRARVDVTRAEQPGFGAALRDLHARRGVRTVLCEGGPRVLGALIADGLLDELFLTVSPLVVGAEGMKNVIEAHTAPGPVPLSLMRVSESEGALLLRYAVGHPG